MTVSPELRERVRRIERPAATVHGVLPFGVAAIDRALPGGGLARGAVHEILGMGGDEEDGALAAAFAAGILGRLMTGGTGIVLWCLPRPDLYGPGLAILGLDPGAARAGPGAARRRDPVGDRGRAARSRRRRGGRRSGRARRSGEPSAAARRGAFRRHRLCAAALARRRTRRRANAICPTQQRRAGGSRRCPRSPFPSALLTDSAFAQPITSSPRRRRSGDRHYPASGPPLAGATVETEPGIGHPRWRVELLRCRGGEPACWEVEVADATGSLSLVASIGRSTGCAAPRGCCPAGKIPARRLRRLRSPR